MFDKFKVIAIATTLFVSISACSTPTGSPALAPHEGAPPAVSTSAPAAVAVHKDEPGEPPGGGEIYFDSESKSTSSKGYAPYGEVYKFNRFERPFTQADRTYLPDVDIQKFHMAKDANWDYAVITLIGQVAEGNSIVNYGVEIDLDRDGRGDLLIWAAPPYSKDWSNDNLQVYKDSNHDVGGASPVEADPPPDGNGYDQLILDKGQGGDPDLAWVRIDPQNANNIEFAFKNSLAAGVKGFLWNAWADAGLKDVTRFNYNDHFTKAEAGSSLKDDPEFPPKQLYAMDNTCRLNFGFTPTGYEPLLCPPIVQPSATPPPAPGNPTSPPPPPGIPPPG
jgi:hypothetical protein